MKNWKKLLDEATIVYQRIDLAKDPDCPLWLLKTYIEYDVEDSVVLTAANHKNCPEWLIERARQRLTESQSKKAIAGDRDQILLKMIEETSGAKLSAADFHLGDRKIIKELRTPPAIEHKGKPHKGKISLVICPAWGIIFPPYNLARLTGSLRADNWFVDVYDVNIESSHYLLEHTGKDYWRSERYFYWLTEFDREILPVLKPLLDEKINKIGTVLGKQKSESSTNKGGKEFLNGWKMCYSARTDTQRREFCDRFPNEFKRSKCQVNKLNMIIGRFLLRML